MNLGPGLAGAQAATAALLAGCATTATGVGGGMGEWQIRNGPAIQANF